MSIYSRCELLSHGSLILLVLVGAMDIPISKNDKSVLKDVIPVRSVRSLELNRGRQ